MLMNKLISILRSLLLVFPFIALLKVLDRNPVDLKYLIMWIVMIILVIVYLIIEKIAIHNHQK
jgi:hypothetical protein